MPRLARVLILSLAATLLAPAAAQGANRGSSLGRPANAGFGCEALLRPNVFTGAPELQPTGHTTCTMRSIGFLNAAGGSSIVPGGKGRITRIKVRAGANPAPVRLTILGASTTLSGTFSCCTARRFGKTFRPRANAVTTRKTDVNVSSFRDDDGRTFSDVVALTATGPGTLPLHNEGGQNTFRQGAALTTFYYPYTRKGEPRPELNGVDGLELLMRWTWQRRR